jgi:riboflavin synthase
MFTGIVTGLGRIVASRPSQGGRDLVIAHPFGALEPGESIAVDGVCLTVEGQEPGSFRAHAVAATLAKTRVADYVPGMPVNLERALQVGDRLGGHLVQGHVDGIGQVAAVRQDGEGRLMEIAVPAAVAEASVPEGSITVDGVSLTVNAMLAGNRVRVALVPYTLEHTTLGARQAGDAVHLEADTIGKYVRALLVPHRRTPA